MVLPIAIFALIEGSSHPIVYGFAFTAIVIVGTLLWAIFWRRLEPRAGAANWSSCELSGGCPFEPDRGDRSYHASDSSEGPMNIHKNVRLTPLRREEIALAVVEGSLSKPKRRCNSR